MQAGCGRSEAVCCRQNQAFTLLPSQFCFLESLLLLHAEERKHAARVGDKMFRKLRSFVWPSFGFRLKTPQFPYCLPRNSVAARRQSDDKLLRCKFHLSSVCMLCVCCDARRGAAAGALSAVYECTLVVVTRAKQRGGRAETSNEQQQSFFAKQDLANVVVVVGHEPPLTPPPPVDAIASRSPPLTDDQAVRLSKELPLAQHLELNRHHPDNGERGEGELLLILH